MAPGMVPSLFPHAQKKGSLEMLQHDKPGKA